MSIGVGLGGLQRDAVLAKDLHGRAADRLLLFDREQKYFFMIIGRLFGHDADVGDQEKPSVFHAFDRLVLGSVPTARIVKEEAARTATVSRFGEVAREVE